ncbi:MAG: DUF2490 domain-containing protein [Elusimicrobiota bacterium]|nr:MAG: DUF2490 domain-containing protein [Elusimicrobiota bacterium]
MYRLSLAVAVVMALARTAPAFELERDAELWTPTFIQAPVTNGWTGMLEVNPRFRGDLDRMNTLIVRPWFGRELAKGTFAHAGYARIRTRGARTVTHEDRAWGQLQAAFKPAEGWTLTVRPRLEQRWLDGATGPAWRARLFVRAERKLRGSLYGVGYAETFVRIGDTPGAPRAGFDQQRLFVGIGRDTPKAKVEAGYQLIRFARPYAADRKLHCLVVNTFLWPWGRAR